MDWVHYTNSTEAINGIIKNGLLINPLKRNLMHLFSNSEHFKDREPQQFGLTSLRKEGIIGSRRHIKHFGNLGIVFNSEWVINEGFKKVWYIKENTRRYKRLKAFFDIAEEELRHCINQRSPNDAFLNMAYTNKAVAGVLGAEKYYRFLSAYEYIEPAGNRWQNEYRFVQKDPFYTEENTTELIQSISSSGWCNDLMTKKFVPSDVSHFVTQRRYVDVFRNSLPEEYKDKEVKWKIYT